MRRDAWASILSWWNCQSPVPHSFGLWITWIVSVEECSSLMQNLMQICCSTSSVILIFFRFYLFIFRESGREGGREGEKHQCVVASHTPTPTGDLAQNPGICPDWKSNWKPFTLHAGTQFTEPHHPKLTQSFWMWLTQYTCSPNSVYHPHWLVQWSHHCSLICIPVHSPWLSVYIDVVQSILVILTISGLFPHKPRISRSEIAES